MNASAVFNWVEDHPYAAAALGIIGLFIILWLLGFFSSSKASEGGGGNMAAAYYAAEAAQAAAGRDIQVTTLQTAAATAIAGRQAQMTEAVAGIQANAATTINQQNTGAATTINSQNTGAAIAIDAQGGYTQRVLSNDQLLSTYNTNYWAGQTAASNNATAVTIAKNNNDTSIYNNFLNNIVPVEIAAGNVYGQYALEPTGLRIGGPMAGYDPNAFRRGGYSEDFVSRFFNL